jgi:hypothetical protein
VMLSKEVWDSSLLLLVLRLWTKLLIKPLLKGVLLHNNLINLRRCPLQTASNFTW